MQVIEEKIILVDKQDQEVGTEEKIKVHRYGLLHRAFSIFVFNDKHELLLQKRALHKYHSGGLWTNTCCSHPRSGETLETAIHRRLMEEMGFDCSLKKAFSFIYKTNFKKENLVEHEFDHVFIGHCNLIPNLNPDEVEASKWILLNDLFEDIQQNPDNYTVWLKLSLEKVRDYLRI